MTPSRIPGLIFRQKGKTIKTPPRSFIKDLDSLPLPARDLMPPLTAYHPTPATYKKYPVGTIITSRGCPYQCTFCFRGVFGNACRFRSPESVVAEIQTLVDRYGAREIRVWDDTFNVDPQRVEAICRLMIKKGIRISWTCLGRVNQINQKMLRLMKKAGCWQISYGIESGNEEILKGIKKEITKQMVVKAIELTYREGIQSLGFFILGLPGDNEQTMEETIEFAKSLPLNAANFTVATPYPGTELWELAKRRGLLKKVAYDKLMVNLPEESFFVPKGMTGKTLLEFEKRAYREFYRNPAFILRQVKDINSLPELWRKAKAFLTIQGI